MAMPACIVASHHVHTVLARLISPQIINLFIKLITEVNEPPRLDLPHFAVQINKSEFINLLLS